MKLSCRATSAEYEFVHVRLSFEGGVYSNVFSQKNNKTVLETLKHKRYKNLKLQAEENYPNLRQQTIGKFLLELKKGWRRFLSQIPQ